MSFPILVVTILYFPDSEKEAVLVARRARSKSFSPSRTRTRCEAPVGLRIIGGFYRGRRLRYSGDPAVRPMKDRVREAVFNLLGPSVRGKHAVDLFAGTGALGLEAISRGAAKATLIEHHVPTARVLAENVETLGAGEQAELVIANVFLRSLWQDRLGALPWLVFCSPPYAYYEERREAMLQLLNGLILDAPEESAFVVESDERFDWGVLPNAEVWAVRKYLPAVIGIYRK